MWLALPQRVRDFRRDLVTGKAEHLAGILLLAGLLEEGIWRAEADELPRRDAVIDQPFRNRCAKAADPRMLLDGRDQREAHKDIGKARLIQRLHGVEADHFRGDS